MNEDGTAEVVRGQDNVFEDLGFSAEEAVGMRIKTDLMLDLRTYIAKHGWSLQQAAEFFGELEPRIRGLIEGEVSLFSIDKLITMLARTGRRVRVEVVGEAA